MEPRSCPPTAPSPDPLLETDVRAGARRTAPGAPPESIPPTEPTAGDAPGAGLRAADQPAPGTSEESHQVTGVASPARPGTPER